MEDYEKAGPEVLLIERITPSGLQVLHIHQTMHFVNFANFTFPQLLHF